MFRFVVWSTWNAGGRESAVDLLHETQDRFYNALHTLFSPRLLFSLFVKHHVATAKFCSHKNCSASNWAQTERLCAWHKSVIICLFVCGFICFSQLFAACWSHTAVVLFVWIIDEITHLFWAGASFALSLYILLAFEVGTNVTEIDSTNQAER